MPDKWTGEQIVEWVTILTIFAFASYPTEMVYLGETSLGKLFVAAIIIYYTMVDVVYGLVACAIAIVYYQLDLYNSYVSLHRDTLLRESMIAMEHSIVENTENNKYRDSKFVGFSAGDSRIYSYIPHELFANSNESAILNGSKKMELLAFFRKEHCDEKGRLMHKGAPVRPEMADHVFREIQFPSDSAKCNPCDKSCDFSIIEERISKEDDLIRPVSGRDAPFDWNQFFGHYMVTPVVSIFDDAKSMKLRVSRYFDE